MATAAQRTAASDAHLRPDVAARAWLGAHVGRLRRTVLLLATLLPTCGPPEAAPVAALADGWHEFTGSWTAAGRRTILHLGPERRVAVLDASGSLLLSGPTRPSVGFHGQVLSFADDLTGMLGRAVWTDDQGDEVFSELDGTRDGDVVHIQGRFVGGTGRYAGATGEYAFEWQYLIESEDGQVQGRSRGLAGRVRADTDAPR